MGVATHEASEDLWASLAAEIERLTAGRTRGKSFSEDFAVDRVCSAIAKLRQQHERQEAEERSAEEIKSLRRELDMEEQRLRIQESKLEDAKAQLRQHEQNRAELQEELEAEEASRREATDGHTGQWKALAYRTHLCLNNLRTKEQELQQLKDALERPEGLAPLCDGLIRRLQSELNAANVEALEAKRESDGLALELSKAERELAVLRGATAAPGGVGATGLAVGPSAAVGGGFLPPRGNAAAIAAGALPGASKDAAEQRLQERDAVREELLRIANRNSVDTSADSQSHSHAAGGVLLQGVGGALGASGAAWSGLAQRGTTPRPAAGPPLEPRNLGASLPPANSSAFTGATARSPVLDEAQKVLERMDRLQARHFQPQHVGVGGTLR